MPYRIVYTKSAVKDISKLDPVAKKALQKKLEQYNNSPLKHARKLIKSTLGGYRWRIGNYRVVFDIKGKVITVLRVGHRREIYK